MGGFIITIQKINEDGTKELVYERESQFPVIVSEISDQHPVRIKILNSF